MNNENLIPNNQRSPSEVREQGRLGGINSGIARREKKELREQMQMLLEAVMKDKGGAIHTNPVTGEPLTYCMAMLLKQLTAAANGNLKAAEFCLKAAGMLTDTTVQNNTQINNYNSDMTIDEAIRYMREHTPKDDDK